MDWEIIISHNNSCTPTAYPQGSIPTKGFKKLDWPSTFYLPKNSVLLSLPRWLSCSSLLLFLFYTRNCHYHFCQEAFSVFWLLITLNFLTFKPDWAKHWQDWIFFFLWKSRQGQKVVSLSTPLSLSSRKPKGYPKTDGKRKKTKKNPLPFWSKVHTCISCLQPQQQK